MYSAFTKKILLFLCALAFIAQQTYAQAPSITDNTGFPTGNGNCTGVAYGNGVYICALYAGKIYISSTGDAWTKVTDAGIAPGVFSRAAFGAGVFVVVGNNGQILTSANGLNWTTRTSGTSNHFLDVQFLQGAFYAVGMNATVRRSTDGITWNTIGMGSGSATDMFICITYGSGAFAIGARSTSGSGVNIYRSLTGNAASWSYQAVSSFLTLNKIVYLKNKFFVFTSSTDVFTSPDAITFTNSTASLPLTQPNATVATIGSPNQVFNGVYDGTKIYLFGYSGGYYQSYGSIFSSADGVNFTLEPKTAYIVCQGSAYINNKYFEYGNEGIVSSTNGTTYKYPTGTYSSLASNGTGYVGVGAVSQSGVIFTSADFNTWTEKTPAAQKELYGVVYDGSKYVAAGNGTVVQSTDNGNTWSQIATPAYVFSTLAYGAGKYFTAGYNSSYAPSIAWSSDGITWTNANTDNNYYFRAKYVNGKFFALGYNNDNGQGVILYSADGVTWTDITPGNLSFPVYYYNDVVYDGTKYHFMGMAYADLMTYSYDNFFSISTATPTNTNSFANKAVIASPPVSNMGGQFGEGAFEYSNGHFLGSVNDVNTGETYIIYSADGTSWTAIDANESVNIYSALAEGDKFRLLGSADGKFTATFSSALPVKLTDFTASAVNDKSLLQWKTVSESNSDHFTVQHSTDAVNWQSIGVVKAAGQSRRTLNYQFTHSNPDKGINYYRLIQADADGRQEISAVKQDYFGKTSNVQLYPNPARGYVQITLPGTANATVSLFNAAGQQVYQQSGSGNKMILLLENLSKGIYQVVISQGAEKYTQQLSHQ